MRLDKTSATQDMMRPKTSASYGDGADNKQQWAHLIDTKNGQDHYNPRYPHSLTTWVRISVLKTRNWGGFKQSLNFREFGKKGVFL